MSARQALGAAAMPRTIGKYVVSHVIGEGAMGIVYKAVDPYIQRSVAIKTIRHALLAAEGPGSTAGARFRQEAQAAGRLNHPNIVSIYECGECDEQDGRLYIAMENVEGASLLSLLRQGVRLGLADVAAVMVQLLDALHCAHEQRVWHCDIKPSNLLVTAEGRVKVSDFGIARIDSADFTLRSAVFGSPGYMAPERYTGALPDQRVDLFSCGVLLYELLTGVTPFWGSASAVMYQVLEHDPPPPSKLAVTGVPPAFDAIVAKALAKRREDRYSSAQEMRDALLAAMPDSRVPRTLSAAAVGGLRPAPADRSSTSPSAPGFAPMCSSASVPSVHPAVPAAVVAKPIGGASEIAQIEALLRPHLGAVSRLAAREVARRGGSVGALVAELEAGPRASHERASGRPVASPTAATMPARSPAPRPAGDLPVLGDTPMRPDIVDKAGRVLASHIGPIAIVLARRAANSATCRERFYCALADRAGADVDRKQLLGQLWRIQ